MWVGALNRSESVSGGARYARYGKWRGFLVWQTVCFVGQNGLRAWRKVKD